MDNLFLTRSLTEAVNNIKPVKTPIIDKVFGKKKFLPDSRFAWDIKTGSERILRNLKVGEPAQISTKAGKSTITCGGTRFSEKRLITAADIENLRQFGTMAPELLATQIADNLEDMRGKVDRTREFMASKALTGVIVDDEGTQLVDFSFAGAQTPVLVGKQLWTDSESSPIANIRAWQKLIVQAVGQVDSWVAFCSSTAMDALLGNVNIRDLMKYIMGDQIAKSGRITLLADVEIEELLGSYINSSAVRTDMIAAGYFALVGVSPQNAAELYAPAADLDDSQGVGSGKPASMFFSKSWAEQDPSGRWVKVEARPLPVLYKPESIVYAKVV
jgi:hypothetical protein